MLRRRVSCVALLLLLLATTRAAWGAGVAGVAGVADTQVDARLDAAQRTVEGTVRISVVNPTDDPLTTAYVWLYPNRFARRPAVLNDVNFHWVYPEEFNEGWMALRRTSGEEVKIAPHALAGRGALVAITLSRPVPPGETLALDLSYLAVIPERYGTFGCVDGTCTLAGGFYPMLATLDAAGWNLEAPPMRSRFRGTLTLAAEADVTVQGRSARRLAVADLRSKPAQYLAVVVAPRRFATVRTHRGVTVSYLSVHAPPPADDAAHQQLPYAREDHAAMALQAVDQAIDLLAEIGTPMRAGTRLTLIEAPLRLELTSAQPGMVVVSDRLFRLFPFKRFRKFHEQVLVRALFAEWLRRRLADDLAAEVGASYLADLYTVRAIRFGGRKQEFARELLAPVAFVPAIDQLIYAPQVAFSDAYFGAIADNDAFRDDPRRFANRRPNGHLLYEKLEDLLTPEAFGEAMRQVVLGEASVPAAVRAAYGKPVAWFFRQWRAAAGIGYPRVNYKLAGRSRARLANGEWRHTIRIVKEATGVAPLPVEPVEVRVVDGAGKRTMLRWDGAGEAGTVELTSASGGVRLVQIDPRYRLVETARSDVPDDPRFDDRTPPRYKFLYNSFGALLNVTDLSAALAADFSIRRVHDNRNSLRMQVYNSEAVTIGAFVGFSRYFGPKVTPARAVGGMSLGLSAARLDFSGDVGTRLSVSVGLGKDDRLVLFEPMRMTGWSLGARYSVTRFDARGGTPADVRQTVSAYGDLTGMVTPWDGHTFVGEVDAAVVAGDLTSRSQLLGAGGPSSLRGYGLTELFGRARVLAHGEWRGTLTHQLDWNLGHFAWVRAMGAAAFVDAGLLSSCERYTDLVGADSFYADAGFGLRFFYDNFGVQPGMTAIDIAVPLITRPRACFDVPAEIPQRAPFMLYVTFIPPF